MIRMYFTVLLYHDSYPDAYPAKSWGSIHVYPNSFFILRIRDWVILQLRDRWDQQLYRTMHAGWGAGTTFTEVNLNTNGFAIRWWFLYVNPSITTQIVQENLLEQSINMAVKVNSFNTPVLTISPLSTCPSAKCVPSYNNRLSGRQSLRQVGTYGHILPSEVRNRLRMMHCSNRLLRNEFLWCEIITSNGSFGQKHHMRTLIMIM